MAIYTKTGDAGTTALFDGTRVPKNSLRVDTYGTFDELNAQVSVCEKLVVSPDNKHVLHTLQHQLFRLCAEVATPHVEHLSESSNLISQQDISELEHMIDDYTKRLPQQHSFILSGNYLSAAELHVARTICRRGERLLISLGSVEPMRDEVRKFINRLSDALYIMARMEDYVQFVETIVERVSERVTTSREEILTGSNQCVGNIEQTAENGVNDMRTDEAFTNGNGLRTVHRRTYRCIYCGCKRCINVFPSYVRCIAHQQRYRTGKGVHSSGSQSGNS